MTELKISENILVKSYLPGRFCWPELSTPDSQSAKQFYKSLFGWQIHDIEIGNGMTYTMFQIDGHDVAAVFQDSGAPSWRAYVSVNSVDNSVQTVEKLGGRIHQGPMYVFESGRMATFYDPTGALVALWQPKNHIGASLQNCPSTAGWYELVTKDPEKASAFYTSLFGWTAESEQIGQGTYTTFTDDQKFIAGMIKMRDELWENPVSHWRIYFTVENCKSSSEKVVKLGGSVKVDPVVIPKIGIVSIVYDPQGASFALIEWELK